MKTYVFEDVLRHASLYTATLGQREDNLYLGVLPRAGWPLGASGTPAKAVMSRGRLTRRSSRGPYRSPEGRGDSRVVIARHQAPMVNVRSLSPSRAARLPWWCWNKTDRLQRRQRWCDPSTNTLTCIDHDCSDCDCVDRHRKQADPHQWQRCVYKSRPNAVALITRVNPFIK